MRGRITFQYDRLPQFARSVLDARDQIQPVDGILQRRQEHMQVAVTCLQGHRGTHEIPTFVRSIGRPLLGGVLSLVAVTAAGIALSWLPTLLSVILLDTSMLPLQLVAGAVWLGTVVGAQLVASERR